MRHLVDESGSVVSESECRSCSERGQSHCQACVSFKCCSPLVASRTEADRDEGAETACPEGRQLRDSIYSRVLPVPCHHAATSDTPTRSQGRGWSDDTAAASVRHLIDETG